jgi:ferredoxin
MIKITVEDANGKQKLVEIPEGITLSLMEVLKASGYSILAVCGGMALCATCLVQVISGLESLPPPNDQEMDVLDNLPNDTQNSRLSCQLRVNEEMDGMVFRITGEN